VRVDTLLRNAIFDTTEARACIVALLTSLLTVGTCVLDLPALAAGWRSGHDATGERVHVHRHTGVSQRMHGHSRLQIGGLSFIGCWFVRFWGWAVWHLYQSGVADESRRRGMEEIRTGTTVAGRRSGRGSKLMLLSGAASCPARGGAQMPR